MRKGFGWPVELGSRHGTLLQAAEAAVQEVPAGYLASELEAVLHVPVKEVLLQLTLAGRIDRHDFHGLYLYLYLYLYTAKDRIQRQQQRAARHALWERVDDQPDQERAAIVCTTACWMSSNAGSARGWRV
ncbi:MAG: hypothetical protein EXS31_05790 [Pedosphaera sp.]|nr:hypothetical protein [Pedosphaera sp.]